VGTPVGKPEHNAFDRLRARVVLPGIAVGTMLGVAALFLGARLIAGPTFRGSLDERALGTAAYVCVALVIAMLAGQARLDWARVFGRPMTAEMLPLALVMVPVAIITVGASLVVYIPLSYIAPAFVTRLMLDPNAFTDVTSIGQWTMLMVAGVVAAPIVEEVLFRGILMQRWAHRWGTPTGVVASSILFAIGHEEWVGHFLFGAALALLYLRTRSLWLPIAAHALNNGVALLTTLPRAITRTHEPAQTLADFRGDAVWIAPLLAAGVLTGWLYVATFWPDGAIRRAFEGTIPYDANA
jgi:membrane protease YdiL (CAAX protease family)